MQLGSAYYQYAESHFVIVHPFTYIIIAVVVLAGASTYMRFKKRKS